MAGRTHAKGVQYHCSCAITRWHWCCPSLGTAFYCHPLLPRRLSKQTRGQSMASNHMSRCWPTWAVFVSDMKEAPILLRTMWYRWRGTPRPWRSQDRPTCWPQSTCIMQCSWFSWCRHCRVFAEASSIAESRGNLGLLPSTVKVSESEKTAVILLWSVQLQGSHSLLLEVGLKNLSKKFGRSLVYSPNKIKLKKGECPLTKGTAWFIFLFVWRKTMKVFVFIEKVFSN